jgi:predicted RNA-binding Zn-ribbon protein involved in translation (DUF1610 family)
VAERETIRTHDCKFVLCPECGSDRLTRTLFTAGSRNFNVQTGKLININQSDYNDAEDYSCRSCGWVNSGDGK